MSRSLLIPAFNSSAVLEMTCGSAGADADDVGNVVGGGTAVTGSRDIGRGGSAAAGDADANAGGGEGGETGGKYFKTMLAYPFAKD